MGTRESFQVEGQLLTRPLITQLKYKLMRITVHAALQRQFHSPFIFRERIPQPPGEHSEPCRPGLMPCQLGEGSSFAKVSLLLLQERDGQACLSRYKITEKGNRDKQAIGTEVGRGD